LLFLIMKDKNTIQNLELLVRILNHF
jgi:hypothetical protein